MSAAHAFIRRLNFTSMTTPSALAIGQKVVGKIGVQEAAAAARWGGVVGLTAFWFIEPYDWLRSLREGDADAQ